MCILLSLQPLTEVNTCCEASDWAEGGGEMSTPLHVPICLSLFMIRVVEELKTRFYMSGGKARQHSGSSDYMFKKKCVATCVRGPMVPIKTRKPENCGEQLINIINNV